MRKIPFVLFGATGDLARKMLLPALMTVFRDHQGYRLQVVGVADTDHSVESFREYISALLTDSGHFDKAQIDEFVGDVAYVRGDYGAEDLYEELATVIESDAEPIFYLAIPPRFFEVVVDRLEAAGFAETGRVMVEKPFGRDLADARQLSSVLTKAFSETQIYRIDHFLGKEAVQNLLVFRFANSILEPLWNRNYVSRIELNMLEDFGVEGRGAFYDGVGVLRDVVQNHLLQLLCLLLMEPPLSMSSDAVASERVKVLSSMEPFSLAESVLGQYRGYMNEPGVTPGSSTPTFVAVRVRLNSWRWAGVPVFIRAGKAVDETKTNAIIEFRSPPTLIFDSNDTHHQPEPNRLIFEFKPQDLIDLRMQAKVPGPNLRSAPVSLEVGRAGGQVKGEEPYAQLIDDVTRNDQSRFASEESVEAAWRVVSPLLDQPASLLYGAGTGGPREADGLVSEFGGWC
ncbi:glucose-6-phosphate dehydrogenase [Ferrimicrobium sp.]|uniref:glucose-6-phosphate dehydrogenase n=1 Tax=Ferrimicrobium sp. TaxID=2926050 RepID=UPI00261A46AA|nr:glucose-6-phosphate dehydrogenase [Ferrimicrobium sp.]